MEVLKQSEQIIDAILSNVRLQILTDMEKFTVIFMEKKLAAVYVECQTHAGDSE